jgi:glutamyl-tRNA reductase
MSIIVCGINHKTASLALREKVFFTVDKLPLYLQDLLSSGIAQEAVLLSTCNRSELYCEASDFQAVQNWFCEQSIDGKNENKALRQELLQGLYLYQGQKAVEHLMRVACGLDSMVLGEPEILGQVKVAFSESCSAGAVGSSFHRLFQQVFALAKEIRSTTAIGACPMSIASTTMTLAKRLLAERPHKPFAESNILLLGAGDTIQLILRYLQVSPVKKIWIVNRSVEKAASLAATYGGEAVALAQLDTILPQADLMITATGSLEPLVTAALLKKTRAAAGASLAIFDIAVPRDVEAEAATLPGIQLYCIDDLKAVIQDNHSNRMHAAEKAQEVIKKRSEEWLLQRSSQDQVSDTIRAYREQIEAICEAELDKALRQLENQLDAETVLRNFVYGVTNKLLHAPSVQLRQAGSEGRLDLLRLAKQLLAIPEFEQKVI